MCDYDRLVTLASKYSNKKFVPRIPFMQYMVSNKILIFFANYTSNTILVRIFAIKVKSLKV